MRTIAKDIESYEEDITALLRRVDTIPAMLRLYPDSITYCSKAQCTNFFDALTSSAISECQASRDYRKAVRVILDDNENRNKLSVDVMVWLGGAEVMLEQLKTTARADFGQYEHKSGGNADRRYGSKLRGHSQRV